MTLENNPYEEAFGQLMKILMYQEHPVFDSIIKNEPIELFGKFVFAPFLIRECWVQWLLQNSQKTKDYDIFKELKDDSNDKVEDGDN